jgi:hypothetical protein
MKGNPIPIAKSFDRIALTFHLYQFELKWIHWLWSHFMSQWQTLH